MKYNTESVFSSPGKITNVGPHVQYIPHTETKRLIFHLKPVTDILKDQERAKNFQAYHENEFNYIAHSIAGVFYS